MAIQEHLDLLKQGADIWNQWRQENPNIRPDLERADLTGAHLSGANLSNAILANAMLGSTRLNGADLSNAQLSMAYLSTANLSGANLSRAGLSLTYLVGANLSGANLSYANLSEANLGGTDLRGANLFNARLKFANLYGTNLSNANLSNANLRGATLLKTNLEKANMTGCSIYATSVWDVQLEGAIQSNLIITDSFISGDGLLEESVITVDNLEVAQFIYLLLNNQKIREIIDTVTSKVVLLLGRFTSERKVILDALRDELRKNNYSPVLFDFEKPVNRDLTETVSTLAHLARFIIVDLTDPSSAPHEIATVIPQTVVPVQPILLQEPLLIDGKLVGRREYAMFEDLRRRYHWVLPTFRYQDTDELLALLQARIIDPAEQKVRELTTLK